MTRRGWWALGAMATVLLLVQLPASHATAWHFFELSADLLTGRGPDGDAAGLRLYADHPELQFGPISIVVALPFTLLGGAGEVLVMAVASAVGLGVVWLLLDAVERRWPGTVSAGPEWAVVLAGALIVATWSDVAVRTAHVDDAIALTALAAGLRWLVMDRAGAATLALALAAAAKPWAVLFVPVLAVPPGAGRWRRPVIAASVAVATWLPFILASPETLDTSDFGIRNDPTSSLRALGIDDPTTPSWVRPAQLVGGLALVALVVLFGRWPGAVLTGFAWRLLLDPGVHRYYTVGFVMGALFLELRRRPGRVPWMTATAAAILELTAVPDAPVGPGQAARLVVLGLALVLAWRSALDSPPTGDPMVTT